MKAFDLGPAVEVTDEGSLRGIQREVACDCWFTSKGRSIPRLIKIMDEQGIIHTITDIEIMYTEDKNYSGVPTVEHICRITWGGRREIIKLIYTKESCKWNIYI